MATITDLYRLPVSLDGVEALQEAAALDSIYALYHTVPLDKVEISRILSAAVTESQEGACKLAVPSADFSTASPAAVAEAHLALALAQQQRNVDGSETGFHPTAFVLIDEPDWRTRGLLLVSLSADGSGRINAFRTPVQGCIAVLQNMESGNSSWEESADEACDTIDQMRPTGGIETLAEALPLMFTSPEDGKTRMWKQPNSEEAGPGYLALYTDRTRDINANNLTPQLVGPDAWERDADHKDWACNSPPWGVWVKLGEGMDRGAMVKRVVEGQRADRDELGEDGRKFHPDWFVFVDTEEWDEVGVLLGHIIDDKAEGEDGVTFERVKARDVVGLFLQRLEEEKKQGQ